MRRVRYAHHNHLVQRLVERAALALGEDARNGQLLAHRIGLHGIRISLSRRRVSRAWDKPDVRCLRDALECYG